MREFNRITPKNQGEKLKKDDFSQKLPFFLRIFPKSRHIRDKNGGQMIHILLPIECVEWNTPHVLFGQTEMMQIEHLLCIVAVLH